MGIGQTTVAATMTPGFAGMCADTSMLKDVVSAVNAEASAEIAFGLMVVQGTGDDEAKLPSATTDKLKGIVAHSHAYEKDQELGDTGLKPGVTLGLARHGRWLVPVDEAVTPADAVRVRMDTNGGKVPGQFCKTASAGHTVDISKLAQWRTSTTGAGVAELEVDLTNVALATAD